MIVEANNNRRKQRGGFFKCASPRYVNSASRHFFSFARFPREIPGIKCYSTDPCGTPAVRDSPV